MQMLNYTVEPLNCGHTIGIQHFVHYILRGVPNSGASGILPVGVVLRIPAVKYNVAALSFAVCWQGRLSRG